MGLLELVRSNRSYRRFYQEQAISQAVLNDLVELARLSASAANLQPLKYKLSWTPEKNEAIFKTLGWAGYLKDWAGPGEGEKPSAYIVILKDTAINKGTTIDEGIAAQSILLGAVEKGYGGCMLGNIKKAELKAFLTIPENLEIVLVIALGKPKETVVLESVGEDGSIRYHRDEKEIHYVPKRSLSEIILE